jgi:hypothetical protein
MLARRRDTSEVKSRDVTAPQIEIASTRFFATVYRCSAPGMKEIPRLINGQLEEV